MDLGLAGKRVLNAGDTESVGRFVVYSVRSRR